MEELPSLIAAQEPGWALERPFYTDPALFEVELEWLFFRQWLYAGHESRIPNPGDYFTYQVGQEPLFLICGDDGEVRALFNICRHKGSRICLEKCGTVRKLVCPYHKWVYERDGRLLHARYMPDDFDRAAFSLRPAQVHLYDGLIFVCLSASPPPFPTPPRDWIAPY